MTVSAYNGETQTGDAEGNAVGSRPPQTVGGLTPERLIPYGRDRRIRLPRFR